MRSSSKQKGNILNKYIYIIIICAISLFGIHSRFELGKFAHPDGDDLFQYHSIQNHKNFSSIFEKDSFYGDHTSFPGEYILSYIPMKILNAFNEPGKKSYPLKQAGNLRKGWNMNCLECTKPSKQWCYIPKHCEAIRGHYKKIRQCQKGIVDANKHLVRVFYKYFNARENKKF